MPSHAKRTVVNKLTVAKKHVMYLADAKKPATLKRHVAVIFAAAKMLQLPRNLLSKIQQQ